MQRPTMDDYLRTQYMLRDTSTCQRDGHDLFTASFCGTSQGGESVYLLCICGQQRRITRADWETVEQASATKAHEYIARETDARSPAQEDA